MEHITGRKVTDWDFSGFDHDEEYGEHSRNARGKRLKYVKSHREKSKKHFRQSMKRINLDEYDE